MSDQSLILLQILFKVVVMYRSISGVIAGFLLQQFYDFFWLKAVVLGLREMVFYSHQKILYEPKIYCVIEWALNGV